MKFLSEVEKLWIKNNIENHGFCWFNSSFIIDLLIMNGEYYNKNFLGLESERIWNDQSISLYFLNGDDENNNVKLAADNDSFVWVKQPATFEDLYTLVGKTFDYKEFEKNEHQQFKTSDELFLYLESWMDEYGEAMMKLIKITEEKNEAEEVEK